MRNAVVWRALALVCALVLGAGLAGCAGGASTGRHTLRVWFLEANAPELAQGYQRLVADFERQHSGVRVDLATVPYSQYRDKLVLAEQGGTGPDVMVLDQIWTPEFAAAGLIQPVDVPERWRAGYFPGAWESTMWSDRQWGLPLNADVWQRMFYNADLFRRAGLDPAHPPRTWPQWLAAARRVDGVAGASGVGLIGCRDEAASVWTDSLVYSAGGHILADGRADFDNPVNRHAYRVFAGLTAHAPDGVAGACDDDTVAHFTAGNTGMLLAGGWQEATIAESARFDWRVTTTPAPVGQRFVGALGGWNLAVSTRAPDKRLAFEFIELASRTPRHQIGVNDSVPALREAGERYVRESRSKPEEMLRLLEQGRPRPVTPVYNRISRAQQDAVQAILGGTSVPEALADAEPDMQRAIDRP